MPPHRLPYCVGMVLVGVVGRCAKDVRRRASFLDLPGPEMHPHEDLFVSAEEVVEADGSGITDSTQTLGEVHGAGKVLTEQLPCARQVFLAKGGNFLRGCCETQCGDSGWRGSSKRC